MKRRLYTNTDRQKDIGNSPVTTLVVKPSRVLGFSDVTYYFFMGRAASCRVKLFHLRLR